MNLRLQEIIKRLIRRKKMPDPWNINWGGNDLSGVIALICSVIALWFLYGVIFGN